MSDKGKHINSKMKKQWLPVIKKVIINGTKNYSGVLTSKQLDVLTEWMMGQISQEAIGKKLNICQTSVHKTLFGNIDYVKGKRYGGVFNKIDKFHSGNYSVSPTGYLKKK